MVVAGENVNMDMNTFN